MTDARIAKALAATLEIEHEARVAWETTEPDDQAERDSALVVMREATALRKLLERWIGRRAIQAADRQRIA